VKSPSRGARQSQCQWWSLTALPIGFKLNTHVMQEYNNENMNYMSARINAMESKLVQVRNLLKEYEEEYITHSQFIIKLRALMFHTN